MPLADVRQRQVGAHSTGAVADEAGEVMSAPALAGTHLRKDWPLKCHEGLVTWEVPWSSGMWHHPHGCNQIHPWPGLNVGGVVREDVLNAHPLKLW